MKHKKSNKEIKEKSDEFSVDLSVISEDKPQDDSQFVSIMQETKQPKNDDADFENFDIMKLINPNDDKVTMEEVD